MSRNTQISLVLLLFCHPAAAGAMELFLPGGYWFEGVAQEVVLLAQSNASPPSRIRAVEQVGSEIHIYVERPTDTVPVPIYEFTMTAELPPLTAGSHRLKVFDGTTPPTFPQLNIELEVGVSSYDLTYAGPPAPTTEDEILVRVNRGICAGSSVRIDRGDFDLRLWGCWIANSQNQVISLGRLAAGTWNIEVDSIDYPLARIELTVAELPAEPGIFLAGDFEVEVAWRTALGEDGEGQLVQPPSEDSALFYFFSPVNWELMVKVLNGCAINGHYWVFGAASTDVGYTVDIRRRGSEQTFRAENPIGTAAAAITDITAFPCDPDAP